MHRESKDRIIIPLMPSFLAGYFIVIAVPLIINVSGSPADSVSSNLNGETCCSSDIELALVLKKVLTIWQRISRVRYY